MNHDNIWAICSEIIERNLRYYNINEGYKTILELQLKHLKGQISYDELETSIEKYLTEFVYDEEDISKIQKALISRHWLREDR